MPHRADISDRVASMRHDLLRALQHANRPTLDGSRDAEDLADLLAALERVKNIRIELEVTCKRMQFHRELERLRSGSGNESGRWQMVSLVRLGVDSGYTIEEARVMIEAVIGKAIAPSFETPSTTVDPPKPI